jgi:hypothetical protein
LNQTLRSDQQNRKQLLETAVQAANTFLDELPTHPAAINPGARHFESAWHLELPIDGPGALEALAQFTTTFDQDTHRSSRSP